MSSARSSSLRLKSCLSCGGRTGRRGDGEVWVCRWDRGWRREQRMFQKCNSAFSCPFITSWFCQRPQRLTNQWETLLPSPDARSTHVESKSGMCVSVCALSYVFATMQESTRCSVWLELVACSHTSRKQWQINSNFFYPQPFPVWPTAPRTPLRKWSVLLRGEAPFVLVTGVQRGALIPLGLRYRGQRKKRS